MTRRFSKHWIKRNDKKLRVQIANFGLLVPTNMVTTLYCVQYGALGKISILAHLERPKTREKRPNEVEVVQRTEKVPVLTWMQVGATENMF